MIIEKKTVIGFKIPNEYEAEKYFAEHNDMSRWRKDETSEYVWYTNIERLFTQPNE